MKQTSRLTKLALAFVCVFALAVGLFHLGNTLVSAQTGEHGDHTAWTALESVPAGNMTSGNYYLPQSLTRPIGADCKFPNTYGCDCADDHIVIPYGVTVEVCLNGNTLDLGHCGIEVKAGGTLKIHDCQGTGTLTSINQKIEQVNLATIHAAGNVEVTGGTVEYPHFLLKGNHDGGFAIRAQGTSLSNMASATVNGGTVTGWQGIISYGYANITVNGGNVLGVHAADYTGMTYGIQASSSGSTSDPKTVNIKVTGGKVEGKVGIRSGSSYHTLEISGGTVTGYGDNAIIAGNSALYLSGTPTVTTQAADCAAVQLSTTPNVYATATADAASSAYTGGKITFEVPNSLALGTAIVRNNTDTSKFALVSDVFALSEQDGNLVLVEKPHTHGDTPFTEWVAQGADVVTGGYYYLKESNATAHNNNIIIASDANVTLCLNGYTLDMGSYEIYLRSGSTFTLCDCAGNGNITTTGTSAICNGGGTLEVQSGTVNGGSSGILIEAGDVTLNGGTVTGGIYHQSSGVLTVDGGTVIDDGNDGIINENNGTVHIISGTVVGSRCGIFNISGKVTVSGGTVTGNTSRGIDNRGTLTVSGDCVINGVTGIFNYDATANILGGTITGTQRGISNSEGTLHVSGGTISATDAGTSAIFTYGIATISGGTISGSIAIAADSVTGGTGTLHLSGTPTITGDDTNYADIQVYSGDFYAQSNDATPIAYSGSPLTVMVYNQVAGDVILKNASASQFTLVQKDGYLLTQGADDNAAHLVLAEAPKHTHYICGGETCTGHPDGTTHSSTVTYDKALTMTSDGVLSINGVEQSTSSYITYTLSSGNYYVTADSAKASELGSYRYIEIPSGAVVNLCLADSTFSVYWLKVEGTLNLCDCGANGKLDSRQNGLIASGGTLNVYGGTVTASNCALEARKSSTVTVYGGTFLSTANYALEVDNAKLTVYDGAFTTTSTSLKQGVLNITAAGTGTDVDIFGGQFTSTNDVILLTDNHYSAADDHTQVLQISGGTFKTTGTGYCVLKIATYGDNTPFCNITPATVIGTGLSWLDEEYNFADPTVATYAAVMNESDHVHQYDEIGKCSCGKTDYDLAIGNLNTAINNLNTAIADKASQTALQQAIKDLEVAYKAADAALELALQGEINTNAQGIKDLQDAMASADKSLQDAIDEVAGNLETAKNNLQSQIDALNGSVGTNETNIAALQQAIKDLETAYKAADAALELALQGEIDTNAQGIKDLQDAMASADKSLQDAIDEVAGNLETAKNNLQSQIDALNDSVGTNKTNIAALQQAIKDLEVAYKAADAALELALQGEIDTNAQGIKDLQDAMANADKSLQDAIDEVAGNLETAKNNLQSQIDALNGSVGTNETNIAALQQAIKDLEVAYKAADAVINGKLDDLAKEDGAIKDSISNLATTVANADKALQDAIDEVAGNLETAKDELNNAIAKGDAALDEKISHLDQAYKAADALINSSIAELAAELPVMKDSIAALNTSLATAKSELEAAIAQVGKNLADAKAELEAKDDALKDMMNQKDEELSAAIDSLNTTTTALIISLSIIGVIAVGGATVTTISFVKKRKI